jgi:hypothetical protein
VTTRTPTLHWALPSGVADVTIDLCLDRACAEPIGDSIHVTGTSYTPTSALTPGVVYWRLHPGTATSVTSPTWQFTVGHRSAAVDASWGTTLDVNGDGYADLAVVGLLGNAGDGYALMYVYLGSAAGFAATPATTVTIPNDAVGVSATLAGAGDVNGDGYADIVVGANFESLQATGTAYVYLGGANGLATTPAVTLTGPAGLGGFFGKSVASAGDVNGDGYADVVVGALLASAAYVYLGGATGLATTPATTLTGVAQTYFSSSVQSAGDVNGDGYADVIVGAGMADTAYVYLGSASGLATTPATTWTSPDGDAGFTGFGGSMACAGDVNGDGYADVIVGSDLTGTNVGSAYIYLGSATGLTTTPSTTLIGPELVGDFFGTSVASAGDVNGDGYGDVVVGAEAQGTATQPGGAWVYLGSAAGLSTTPATTLMNPNAATTTGTFFGASVVSAGDVTGNGFSDLAVGAFAENPSTDVGSVYVYSGGPNGINADDPAITLTPPASTGDGGTVDNAFGAILFGATN